MTKQVRISKQTRNNWLIDAILFLGAIIASLSGIYFLFFTSGGYQGGRNAFYGITFLFTRATWGDLHLWGGVIMIAAVAIHAAIHWRWIKMMARRYFNVIKGRGAKNSRGAKVNVVVNFIIALSFLLAALSGIYFLFFTSGGYEGGNNLAYDQGLLFSRTTWDLIHTWSGVALIVATVIHFAIHWRWVKNVTARVFQSRWQRPQLNKTSAVG